MFQVVARVLLDVCYGTIGSFEGVACGYYVVAMVFQTFRMECLVSGSTRSELPTIGCEVDVDGECMSVCLS